MPPVHSKKQDLNSNPGDRPEWPIEIYYKFSSHLQVNKENSVTSKSVSAVWPCKFRERILADIGTDEHLKKRPEEKSKLVIVISNDISEIQYGRRICFWICFFLRRFYISTQTDQFYQIFFLIKSLNLFLFNLK